MTAPRLFISYSWTTPDHEMWVLKLATELIESDIDVILDKWDLKEGHNAAIFMEQMVTDPTITKVILVCDKMYAEKSDGRAGGAGTEAQIISPVLYDKAMQQQDKFVAVVVARDPEGYPYLPTYYKGRIYIDLGDEQTYAQNFETLLRWIFDKRVYQKPERGTRPAFLNDESAGPRLATTVQYRRALEAIKHGRPTAESAAVEYFDTLVAEFEKLRLTVTDRGTADTFDNEIVASIEAFVPTRNELIELFRAIAAGSNNLYLIEPLHRMFEQLLRYTIRPLKDGIVYDSEQDNYKFIVHELFLYCIALLLKRERFAEVGYLLTTEYFFPQPHSSDGNMQPFTVFREYLPSLERRNARSETQYYSLHAVMLKERADKTDVPFNLLMQADFLLFLRAHADKQSWWPETLFYTTFGTQQGFEIFARAKSRGYFKRLTPALGIKDKESLKQELEGMKVGRDFPTWGGTRRLKPARLAQFDTIATTE